MISEVMVLIVGFFGEYFVDVASGLIAVTALYWFWKYDLRLLKPIEDGLKKVNGRMKDVDGYGPENMKKINDIFKDKTHPVLKDLWADYYYGDFQNSITSGKSLDIRDYFDVASTITLPAKRKKAEAKPGLLTAMGILGTFLGLIIGVGGVDVNSADAIKGSMSSLLDGVAVAFSVSVVAIILSIIFQILDKQLYHKAAAELHTFQRIVERKVPIPNDTLFLERLAKGQEQQSFLIEKMGDEITVGIVGVFSGGFMDNMSAAFEKTIQSSLKPQLKDIQEALSQMSHHIEQSQTQGMQKMVDYFIQSLNSTAGGQLEAFGQTLAQLSQAQLSTKENLEVLIGELSNQSISQKEINEASGTIVKTISQYQQDILKANKELAQSLEKTNYFTEAFASMAASNQDTLERLNEERVRMEQQTTQYFENMNNHSARAQQNLNEQMDKVFNKFNSLSENLFDKMSENMSGSVEELQNQTRTMLESVDSQVKSMALYSRELSRQIQELNNHLENAVKEFNQQVHQGVEKTFTDFDKGLSEICLRLSKTITEIGDAVDDLPAAVQEFRGMAAAAKENE